MLKSVDSLFFEEAPQSWENQIEQMGESNETENGKQNCKWGYGLGQWG